jgi:hypothetical protein
MPHPTLVIPFVFLFYSILFYGFAYIFNLLVYAEWDVERLAEKVKGYNALSEDAVKVLLEDLRKYFLLGTFGSQNEPCTVVDCHGRIVIWHLPDILWKPRLVNKTLIAICVVAHLFHRTILILLRRC